MTSRERILAALNGKEADYIPMTTWCFGFPAPSHLKWETKGKPVDFWYTKRLEHLHNLPIPWTLQDEFKRAAAWLSVGIDDALEVSVPWSMDGEVAYKDSLIQPGQAGGDERYPVMVREYTTPAGALRHAIKRTGDEGPGWPLQPDCVPIIEDYNIPRAVEHAVSGPDDVEKIKYLFAPPNGTQKEWFAGRMDKMKAFADEKGLFTQAWTAFGMDAAVWFTGTQGAIMMAMDAPEAFRQMMETIFKTDYTRTELAAQNDGVDMVCQRGWYSSTDFWSPSLFDRVVFPYTKQLADLAHKHTKKFGYVMTTGVETLGPRLADAGVDLLFFVDPIQDGISVEKAKELFGDRMTMVGGTNALSLQCGNPQRIRDEVKRAIEVLGPTNRFVLHPMDAIFPDTPWDGVEQMIEAWREYR